MTSRQRRALLVYQNRRIVPLGDDTYLVNARKRKGKRPPPHVCSVGPEAELTCGCHGFRENGDCAHLGALARWLTEGPPGEPYDRHDESKRPSYPQDNPRYRVARKVTAQAVPLLVRALARTCYPITGARGTGRPPTEMADLVLCVALRVFNGKGGTITQAFVEKAFEEKLLYRRPIMHARPPSEEAITRGMQAERTAEALSRLIEASNDSYRGNATTLLIDGSEFEIPTLLRPKTPTSDVDSDALAANGAVQVSLTEKRPIWHQTVKLHGAVSAEDGMFVAAIVTSGKAGDATQAVPLLEHARRIRFVSNLAADRAYLTNEIVAYCGEHGIKASIPSKVNSSIESGTLLAEHVAQWRNRTDEERTLYAKRSLVESAFARMKRLMADDLRSRTFAAQKVELLAHVLVANICWLIQRYVAGDVEIPWLDDRCRAVLDPAREAVAEHPRADRSPRFRDGIEAA